jgi:CDP-glucose 4,6-dehydratase
MLPLVKWRLFMSLMTMSEGLDSFRGKRVFITGHTGFKGSWLAFLLTELGAEVAGYALAPESEPSHFVQLDLDKKINHILGDVRDAAKLKGAVNDFQPDVVFHLAAQALVKKSYLDPSATFDVNVMGSVNLLESVIDCESIRSLVFVTSDKCYENMEWIWGYRENDRLGGHDPYSASKAAAEIVFSAYVKSYFTQRSTLGAASVRAGNVIGGGDWSQYRIIPDCIRAFESGQPIQLRNPNSTRPWQHVLEPLSGYLLLGANLLNDPAEFTGSWNFGPPASDVRTVFDVASSIMEHLGGGNVNVMPSQDNQHEAQLLQLNCDRANQLLGWHSRWNANKTLLATADWFKKVGSGMPASQVTSSQIRDYFLEIK